MHHLSHSVLGGGACDIESGHLNAAGVVADEVAGDEVIGDDVTLLGVAAGG